MRKRQVWNAVLASMLSGAMIAAGSAAAFAQTETAAVTEAPAEEDGAETAEAETKTDEAETETLEEEVSEAAEEEGGTLEFEEDFEEGLEDDYVDDEDVDFEVEEEPAVVLDIVYEDDDIKLAQYKGLTYSTEKMEVTDEDVDLEVEDMLDGYTEYTQLDEGTAADGDTVNIDYEGKVDGVAFDGGTAEDQTVTIGDGMYIPGFEEGIIGMEVGETKDVEVTFPEDYGSEELAGKDAVFTMTLNYIEGDEIVPEYTDEFVKENLDFDSIKDYEASIREELEAQYEEDFIASAQSEMMQAITANSEVKNIDEERVEYYKKQFESMYQSYASMFGMEYEDFKSQMGLTDESLAEEAENVVKTEVIINKIAELENITAEEDELIEFLDGMAADYGFESGEDLKAALEEQGNAEDAKLSLLQSKVGAFLVENGVYEAPVYDEEAELLDDEEVLEGIEPMESEEGDMMDEAEEVLDESGMEEIEETGEAEADKTEEAAESDKTEEAEKSDKAAE